MNFEIEFEEVRTKRRERLLIVACTLALVCIIGLWRFST